MHAHVVLMLAATVLVGGFVGIVVGVTLLQRRGRLGDPARRLEFTAYGPILAGAFSGGAAAVHLIVAAEHTAIAAAASASASSSIDAFALLCSIGAGTTSFSTADASLAPFLPLGVASLGAIVAQGVLAVPRAWRSRRGLVVGLAVTLVALVIALAARLLTRPVVDSQQLAYSDTLAIVFDIALLGTIALLAVGRPRRLRERLRVPVMDAWVGTGLGVTAVGIFTVAGYFLAHAPH